MKAWLSTRGLSAKYREQVESAGCVDFTKIRQEDVKRVVPGKSLDIDWTEVIFIKNIRGPKRSSFDTIVWSRTEGFYRTKVRPRMLLNRLAEDNGISWFDMTMFYRYLHLTGRVPFVIGPLMFIPTEVPKSRNHTSWIGGQFVRHINEVAKTNGKPKVRIDLANHMEMVIWDSEPRLRKSLTDAQAVLRLEQAEQAVRARTNSVNASNDWLDAVSELYQLSKEIFAKEVLHKAGFDKEIKGADIKRIVREIDRGNNDSLHLNDER
ncbi:hypothetical protein FD13_GL001253 [Levilactobacillus senmaizukei DSM 21775 = NBRC 103853]|uniref:Uncharacterized protein n=1 Tax=Levilactobacillus senmaizukei DSM 21775 = NBRC 103853 TaxID=1423803 RepID=A0A0R2DG28_9LACO|nr:hypothetical protein [Levilactobacillus senmaizukei]KRN02937.1 hypothetical protein FD13_GL001253 [Levilactobacillus senmaizukei DSM 21775 = NBRC 103853]